MNNKTPLPEMITRHYGKVYPDAWKQAEKFRLDKGNFAEWPEWCYLPLAASFAIISAEAARQKAPIHLVASDVGNLGAIIPWRMTKGIYKFDKELLDALWTTPLDGDLPVELFFRLPEWCCYIDIETEHCRGFFVYLEHDANSGHQELRFSFVSKEGPLVSYPLHLKKEGVISGVKSAMEFSVRNAAGIPGADKLIKELATDEKMSMSAEFIAPYVSIVLYLCSVNADIHNYKNPQEKPAHQKPKKTKNGLRYFPADKTQEYRVGSAIGGAIRRYRASQVAHEASGVKKAAHIRRAHFHTYRIGKGRMETMLKWLPPIPINIEDDDIIPTIRTVK